MMYLIHTGEIYLSLWLAKGIFYHWFGSNTAWSFLDGKFNELSALNIFVQPFYQHFFINLPKLRIENSLS